MDAPDGCLVQSGFGARPLSPDLQLHNAHFVSRVHDSPSGKKTLGRKWFASVHKEGGTGSILGGTASEVTENEKALGAPADEVETLHRQANSSKAVTQGSSSLQLGGAGHIR